MLSTHANSQIERVLDTEGTAMIQMMDNACPPRLRRLTRAIGSVVDDYMLVSFTMMDQVRFIYL